MHDNESQQELHGAEANIIPAENGSREQENAPNVAQSALSVATRTRGQLKRQNAQFSSKILIQKLSEGAPPNRNIDSIRRVGSRWQVKTGVTNLTNMKPISRRKHILPTLISIGALGSKSTSYLQ